MDSFEKRQILMQAIEYLEDYYLMHPDKKVSCQIGARLTIIMNRILQFVIIWLHQYFQS